VPPPATALTAPAPTAEPASPIISQSDIIRKSLMFYPMKNTDKNSAVQTQIGSIFMPDIPGLRIFPAMSSTRSFTSLAFLAKP
jgi:hypothetical protein